MLQCDDVKNDDSQEFDIRIGSFGVLLNVLRHGAGIYQRSP